MPDLKKTLHIAVRDLVAHGLRSGDLSFDFLSAARPVDAIRAHQKIQQARPANYSAEVTVSHRLETGLLDLAIGGRIDGVYTAKNLAKCAACGVLSLHQSCGVDIRSPRRLSDFIRCNRHSLHSHALRFLRAWPLLCRAQIGK